MMSCNILEYDKAKKQAKAEYAFGLYISQSTHTPPSAGARPCLLDSWGITTEALGAANSGFERSSSNSVQERTCQHTQPQHNRSRSSAVEKGNVGSLVEENK